MIDQLPHNMLHVTATVVSVVLFIIALLVYMRNMRKRFLFVCLGFFVFSIKEVILAVNVMYIGSQQLEIVSHALDMVILGLFFIGLLTHDEFRKRSAGA